MEGKKNLGCHLKSVDERVTFGKRPHYWPQVPPL